MGVDDVDGVKVLKDAPVALNSRNKFFVFRTVEFADQCFKIADSPGQAGLASKIPIARFSDPAKVFSIKVIHVCLKVGHSGDLVAPSRPFRWLCSRSPRRCCWLNRKLFLAPSFRGVADHSGWHQAPQTVSNPDPASGQTRGRRTIVHTLGQVNSERGHRASTFPQRPATPGSSPVWASCAKERSTTPVWENAK